MTLEERTKLYPMEIFLAMIKVCEICYDSSSYNDYICGIMNKDKTNSFFTLMSIETYND